MAQTAKAYYKSFQRKLAYDGSLVGFDVTVPESLVNTREELHCVLCLLFKKFVYQHEQTLEGYRHFQCRGSLHKKSTCANMYAVILPRLKGHWSVTSVTTCKGSKQFNYVMKADTRIDGPWTDEDTPPVPKKMTRQLDTFLTHEMYPYQKQILDMVHETDDRSIKLIYDPVGDCGKSVFSEYLEFKDLGWELPPLRTIEDIMQFCFSFPDQKCYIIDMPRSMKKDKLGEFYAGIECLKNGFLYETRYKGQKRRMDRPQIIIFTNILPVLSLMSAGRWEIWEMINFILHSYSTDREEYFL